MLIVQNQTASLAEDVAATKGAIGKAKHKAILVSHSPGQPACVI